jgi:hypothetical protein
MGNAQADTVYVWNPLAEDAAPLPEDDNVVKNNKFTLAQNARVGGIVLAHSAEGRNFINLASITLGTSKIANIDLEGHLTNYLFVATDINDWLNKPILVGADTGDISRFSLGTFVGGTTLSLSPYKLVLDTGPEPDIGKLVRR